MKVSKKKLVFLLLVCFSVMMCFNSFASDNSTYNFSGKGTFDSGVLTSTFSCSFDSSSPIYIYHCSSHEFVTSTFTTLDMCVYFLSESSFVMNFGREYSIKGDSFTWPSLERKTTSLLVGGYYYTSFTFGSGLGPVDFFSSSASTLVPCSTDVYFWQDPDFVLGEGGGSTGGDTSSITYDSTIPAPENLKFKSSSIGGFLGIGSKFQHDMTWSNNFKDDSLYVRISALVGIGITGEDQLIEITLPLLPTVRSDGYMAVSRRYSIGTDELAALLKGGWLEKVIDYRVQFYKYEKDVLKVGPVSTIRVKTNVFGKYDGYTVTTERPRDENNLGDSAGQDDFYDDKWTSDGEHYNDYDKDGNLTDSGVSDDGNFFEKIIRAFNSIPKVINSFFDSLLALMSGVGQVPAYLAQLFLFLPVEIISLIGTGVLVVVWLRILGR